MKQKKKNQTLNDAMLTQYTLMKVMNFQTLLRLGLLLWCFQPKGFRDGRGSGVSLHFTQSPPIPSNTLPPEYSSMMESFNLDKNKRVYG
jgi:hypothetical protein